MASLLDIGISGLKAQQTGLSVTGHNITNAGTEGYSRQRVDLTEKTPQNIGGHWIGNGVNVDSVKRMHDQFLTNQLHKDSSTFNNFNTLSNNASQIDSLLADKGTGIQPGLERMFGALQSVVDDPSSLPARQVLISEANGLVDRFSSIGDRLNDQSKIINGQLTVVADQINTIGKSIAELNSSIEVAFASSNGSPPNDLLDQRDKLTNDLSKLVEVRSVKQDGNSVNIFVGNGQSLVLGGKSNQVFAAASRSDPAQFGVFFQRGDVIQEVTEEIVGGEIGGMLEFRKEVLEPSKNALGRIALNIVDTFNRQHKLGIDLDGKKGGDFFKDINDPVNARQRVQGSSQNAPPNDRILSVNIADSSKLTADDYRLEFPGPDDTVFKVFNAKTNKELLTQSLTGEYPQKVEVDGLEINIEAGSFKGGDKFLITPTRFGAKNIEMSLTRATEVAIAAPIVTASKIGNRGDAKISQGVVYDANSSFLKNEGKLDPPIIIRFNSPTNYDVLDNSDPGNPIPLFPPLMNQTYVPGISNSILPGAEGKVAFNSFGGYLPTASTYQPPAPAPTITSNNGFFPERITITKTNPDTGIKTDQPLLTTPVYAPAKEIARLLSERDGVSASARTTVQLSDFKNDVNPLQKMEFSLNGVELTDTLGAGQTKYKAGYPNVVPDPITPNFIADRINNNYDFIEQGIIAKSDGVNVIVTALNGEDIAFEVKGDNGDGFSISNGQDIGLVQTGEAPLRNLTSGSGYDFSENGPFTYKFDVPGQGAFNIELTEKYATGADLVKGIQDKIEKSGMTFSGDVKVSIDEKGKISFQPKLEVSGRGIHGSSKISMGGQIKVIVDKGYSLDIKPHGNNLFDSKPVGEPVHFGFDVNIDGLVKAGDQFTVGFNENGTSDSRNGKLLGALQTNKSVGGNASYSTAYSTMVEEVGSITSKAKINKESSQVLLRNSQAAVNSKAGVNLDEEASALIKYELAYNASAQIIKVARDTFNTLIQTFR